MEQPCIAQSYVNLMAQAFQLLVQGNEQLPFIMAAPCFNEIADHVKEQIKSAQDAGELISTIDALLNKTRDQKESQHTISYAKAIAMCMDQIITYDEFFVQPYENGRISLYSLIPAWSDKKPVAIMSLNTNSDETGICIAPKFPVTSAITASEERRSLASRNALYGINGDLLHVIYYLCGTDYPEVHHIILPERLDLDTIVPEQTRIAFSPLTDRTDLIKPEATKTVALDNMTYRGVTVNEITDSAYIENRFSDIWLSACQKKVDVFFAPEMLATSQMVQVVNSGSVFLKPLLKTALKLGGVPPRLTILPSYWKDGLNQLLIFDETGAHLGTQLKHFPYVDRRTGKIEAIEPPSHETVFIFHLKNQQRIALAVCAEFLTPQAYMYVDRFICEQLGATLVLVSSFSPGEQDFINRLPGLRPYGTSVIWGNCCGAVHNEKGQASRIIGACSYAGIDEISRFGSISKCEFHCNDCKTCLFVLDIPTAILQEKPNSPAAPIVSHFCAT